MNRIMISGIVLMVGMLAIGKVAFSDIVPRTDVLFFSEPIPCHVYLKARQAVADSLHYTPDSFFQVKVQFLRLEPDIHRNQGVKQFLQGQLDQIDARQHPELAERMTKKLQYAEDHHKVIVLRVLETLEGPSPGEEIVISLYRGNGRNIGWKNRYMLGYQEVGGRTRGVSIDKYDLYERDDWFLTDIKRWVRRVLSACDNV